jgi:hypothetical protein
VHDPSVMGVVLPSSSLSIGTVQNIVAEISAGGSLGQNKMKRLLSLVEGKDYKQGQQGDTVEFLRKMATFDIGFTKSSGDASHEINEAVVLEMHVNGLSRFLLDDISGPEFSICAQYAANPNSVIFALDYNVLDDRNGVTSAPCLNLAPLQYITLKGTHYQLVAVGFYQGDDKRGHYVACRKRGSAWYKLDDSHSSEVTIDQAGPSGSGGMVSASVPALGPVPAQACASKKRARRGTQTKEGYKALVVERKRRQRERERAREQEEEDDERI